MTTSYFTTPAQEFAKRHEYKVVLIDGELLARLMIHHSVGVRVVETMHYKKIKSTTNFSRTNEHRRVLDHRQKAPLRDDLARPIRESAVFWSD